MENGAFFAIPVSAVLMFSTLIYFAFRNRSVALCDSSWMFTDSETEAFSGRRHPNLYRTQGAIKRSQPSLDVYSVES